jgi:ribonuclease P/MRP protein subunit RPP40
MEGLGVGGNLLGWVRQWLTGGRLQSVIMNGQQSLWGEIVSGVIQGSCLGPALFLIFINDVDTAVDLTSSLLSKFADDTKWARIVEWIGWQGGVKTGSYCLMLESVRSCILGPRTAIANTP